MKNKGKGSFKRTKNYKELIILGLILVGFLSQSIFAGVIQTDEMDYTTDSELVVDFADASISGVTNITFGSTDVVEANVQNWNSVFLDRDADFNGSDGHGFTWEMAAGWNSTSGANVAPAVNRIVNSNNNSWDVTEANVDAAINDVGTNGFVFVGDDLTYTSGISMDGHDGVFVTHMGHTVTLSGHISAYNVTDCIYGGIFDVTFKLDGTEDIPVIMIYAETDANRVNDYIIHNVFIDNTGGKTSNYNGSGLQVFTNTEYTGIEVYVDSIGGTGSVKDLVVSKVTMEGCFRGIHLRSDGSGWQNFNTYKDVWLDQHKDSMIEFTDNTTGSGGGNQNSFQRIGSQVAVYTRHGVLNIAGIRNKFDHCWLSDISTSTDWGYSYRISGDAQQTIIDDGNKNAIDTVLDHGFGSKVTCGDRTLYYDSDYDYYVFKQNDTYYCRLGLYGDMPDSGSYDKNTDFQALMENICANSNIIVKLGEGSFVPDERVDIDGTNITIRGSGKHLTRIEAGSDADEYYLIGMFVINDQGNDNITFEGITFSGQNMSNQTNCIFFNQQSAQIGLYIYDCRFIHFDVDKSSAITVRPRSDDHPKYIEILNTEFLNCYIGVNLTGDSDSNITFADVSHNEFKDCTFSIFFSYVDGSEISNNIIQSNIATSDGITLDDCFDNIIDGNSVDVKDDGIIETGTSDYNILDGNNCRKSGDPLTTSGGNTVSGDNLT